MYIHTTNLKASSLANVALANIAVPGINVLSAKSKNDGWSAPARKYWDD